MEVHGGLRVNTEKTQTHFVSTFIKSAVIRLPLHLSLSIRLPCTHRHVHINVDKC